MMKNIILILMMIILLINSFCFANDDGETEDNDGITWGGIKIMGIMVISFILWFTKGSDAVCAFLFCALILGWILDSIGLGIILRPDDVFIAVVIPIILVWSCLTQDR